MCLVWGKVSNCHSLEQVLAVLCHQISQKRRGLKLERGESQTCSLHSLPTISNLLPSLFNSTGACESIEVLQCYHSAVTFLTCWWLVSTSPGYDAQHEYTLALAAKMVSRLPSCKGHLDCMGHQQLKTRIVGEERSTSTQHCRVRLQL